MSSTYGTTHSAANSTTHSTLSAPAATLSSQAGPAGRGRDAGGTSCAMGSSDGQRDRDRRHSTSVSGSDRDSPQSPEVSRSPSQPPSLPGGGGIETQRILTVFGSNTRSGYWEPAERLEVLSLFGGVTLDFTDANLYNGTTIVNCLAAFGGIEIIVPAELEVDANGTGLFGGFDLKALKKRKTGIFSRRRSEPAPDFDYDSDDEPPLLRVRGFALFGGVSVKVR